MDKIGRGRPALAKGVLVDAWALMETLRLYSKLSLRAAARRINKDAGKYFTKPPSPVRLRAMHREADQMCHRDEVFRRDCFKRLRQFCGLRCRYASEIVRLATFPTPD